MRRLFLITFVSAALGLSCHRSLCQSRIEGMVPQKWITFKHSTSPGRKLQYDNQTFKVDFEDIYAKIWIPLALKEKFKLAVGPYYRAEQIEFTSLPNSELNSVSHWNLRAAGIDIKALYQLNAEHSLMVGTGLSRSATIHQAPLRSSPVNYMVSAVYMTKKSPNRETGFGFLYSNNMNGIPFLPVIMWNETFNEKNGVEIALPYKLAWRYNLSTRDIFHVKAEGSSRSYYVSEAGNHQFRRTDLDLGLGYTRVINRWTGIELFSGFRQNLSTQLPCDAQYKTMSGFVASVELFVIPAFKRKR